MTPTPDDKNEIFFDVEPKIVVAELEFFVALFDAKGREVLALLK